MLRKSLWITSITANSEWQKDMELMFTYWDALLKFATIAAIKSGITRRPFQLIIGGTFIVKRVQVGHWNCGDFEDAKGYSLSRSKPQTHGHVCVVFVLFLFVCFVLCLFLIWLILGVSVFIIYLYSSGCFIGTVAMYQCPSGKEGLHDISKSGRYLMMTSPNGNIFRVTDPLQGESTGHRWIPITKANDSDLWYFICSAKRLSKQSRRRGFETPSHSLWPHCNIPCQNQPAWALHIKKLSQQ